MLSPYFIDHLNAMVNREDKELSAIEDKAVFKRWIIQKLMAKQISQNEWADRANEYCKSLPEDNPAHYYRWKK